jgi:hypothetical protein
MLFYEDLRVSDADRDAAVDFLTHHYASGRLTADELSARIDAGVDAARRPRRGAARQGGRSLGGRLRRPGGERGARRARRRAGRPGHVRRPHEPDRYAILYRLQ